MSIMKSKEGKEFEILGSKGSDYRIRFIDSGYECRAKKTLVESGLVVDPSRYIEEKKSWTAFHEEYVNNDGKAFTALSKRGDKVRVLFKESGYFCEVYRSNALKGKVKDVLSPSVYGVGVIGIVDKKIPYWRQAFQLWNNMLKRCYSEKDERGYFGEATVDERWLVFENFLADIPKLKGFNGWVNSKETGIKYNLDKDFIIEGNKVYSRLYCMFLPESFNKALGKLGK